LGEVLGFDHYDRGWHATATIGPVAGVSSLAVLLGFDSTRTRSALALAAAQAGGLQRNFGTLAKPVQAGFAAAAAVRAALLVTAGLAGDQDIFGPRGYFELYGDEGARSRADSVAIEASPHLLSRKLYPCCYATHRMIGAAVEARQMLEAVDLGEVQVRLEVPFGTMRPLRVADPADGNEAKFCAAYVAAVALARGTVGLADFTTEAISRPEIRALMERTEIIELPPDPGAVAAILDNGSISLDIVRKGQVVARATRAAHPGSPAAPPTAEEMDAKIADCLAVHARSGGASITPAVFRERIGALLGTPAADQATKARG
jgi:2-methylcitrate dehydratase PrpD